MLQGDRPGQPLQLAYEGEFVRGVRHGQGTANYAGRGEVYTGQWLDGRRTGPGKQRTMLRRQHSAIAPRVLRFHMVSGQCRRCVKCCFMFVKL